MSTQQRLQPFGFNAPAERLALRVQPRAGDPAAATEAAALGVLRAQRAEPQLGWIRLSCQGAQQTQQRPRRQVHQQAFGNHNAGTFAAQPLQCGGLRRQAQRLHLYAGWQLDEWQARTQCQAVRVVELDQIGGAALTAQGATEPIKTDAEPDRCAAERADSACHSHCLRRQ
jgi:hypothetical protein